MTRINVGVHPTELPGPLLLAEHREITRIPNAVFSGRAVLQDIPSQFTLGKGHVKFFYDKQLYLMRRYMELYDECLRRDYAVTYKGDAWPAEADPALCRDYTPQPRDRKLIVDRLKDKGFKLLTKDACNNDRYLHTQRCTPNRLTI